MSRAIESLRSGLTIGHVGLGLRAGAPGSVRQQVHDGDTINVRALGNFAIRFLGIDTPEISFLLPGTERFVSLGNEAWEPILADPFGGGLEPIEPDLLPELVEHLRERTGPGTAANHHRHAEAAEDALEAEMLRDQEILGHDNESMKFFLAFANDIVDGFGRLLCYINRDQPDPDEPEPRPRTYNERLLGLGQALPYFIWPNVNPFRRASSVEDAVPDPGTAADLAEADSSLRAARLAVKSAREQSLGIYSADDPLRLEAFELRFLSRRSPPSRWVIDLTRNENRLLKPQSYHVIPHAEDRLFIPPHYVPLFVERGWKREY